MGMRMGNNSYKMRIIILFDLERVEVASEWNASAIIFMQRSWECELVGVGAEG